MIVITLEGGLVQGISTDDPTLVGSQVVVIDYDAENADPDEVSKIPQGNGKVEDAVVSQLEIGMLYEPVAIFLRKEGGE